MFNKIGFKQFDKEQNKKYLSLFIISCILFVAFGYIVIISINNFLYSRVIENANKQAITHTSRLSNSIEANRTINELLNEKLLNACQTIVKSQKNLNNQVLEDFAKDLNLDKIYWYSSQGQIIYTANDYLGWKAEKGDPVYNFMESGLDYLVEPIRPDVASGEKIKYGQLKAKNGEVVQVGIIADNIYTLTNNFCPHIFIEELVGTEDISHVYFLNSNNKLIFCDEETISEEYILNSEEEKAIRYNVPYYKKRYIDKVMVYEALMPIFIESEKIGTLIIHYSLKNISSLLIWVTIITSLFLIILFLIYIFLIKNIAKKKREIEKIAYTDPISQLYNKSYLKVFLGKIIGDRSKGKKAIIIIVCENLNLIKLTYSQEILEKLIQEKANTLINADINHEHLFHYNENAFCIYIENYKDRVQLLKTADKIVKVFDKTILDKNHVDFLTMKIGILDITENLSSPNNVFNLMDIVINRIYEQKNNEHYLFDKRIQDNMVQYEMIEKELRVNELSGFKEFYIFYQPQVDLKTNKIIGLEALTRWQSKELGIIPPDIFINIAERFQLIVPLGYWVIRNVCGFINRLEKEGLKNIRVAINISIVQLLQEDFVENLTGIINQENIKPQAIELEITESSFAENIKAINDKLALLKNKGIKISLDDFGTGYSSLARLNRLNIDTLKIDKSFIDNININTKENIFIDSIILLANRLGLKTVAEGVETIEQKHYLSSVHCDIIQGYLFSKPIAEDNVIELIRSTNKTIN